MAKPRIVFAKKGEGLKGEVEDYFRVWRDHPKLLKLSKDDLSVLLEIYDDDLTREGLRSGAQIRLIGRLRDESRKLLNQRKIVI